MAKKIAVIGLGTFGESLCTALVMRGGEVLAIDLDDEAVNRVASIVDQAVIADGTNEKAVRELELKHFDSVFVCVGADIEASVLMTLVLKEAGVRSVWVKSKHQLHRKILRKIGADHVINPEREMGQRLAGQLLSNCLLNCFDLNERLSVYELLIPAVYTGKCLSKLSIPNDIIVLGMNRGDDITQNVPPDFMLRAGDRVLIAGETRKLQKIIARL